MKNLFFDGTKTMSLDELPPEAWKIISGKSVNDGDYQNLYRYVYVLYRGIEILRDSAASMPFAIYADGQDDEPLTTSDAYEDVTGWMPDPGALFGTIEAALTIWSKCYFEMATNVFGQNKTLSYLLPSSIDPQFDDDGNLKNFLRRIPRKNSKDLEIKDVLYFWKPDPFVENGAPKSSPLLAAAAAAGLILNVDRFAADFFKRGAIKGTLLTVKGVPSPDERTKIRAWWQSIFQRGSASAFASDIINADSVVPVPIGEGLESLARRDLTEEKREAVATALGIPHSILFSNSANYATSMQDDKNFYSKKIIPDCSFMAGVLNKQLLIPLGYRLKFRPETLDAFQQEESDRSTALQAFLGALEKAPTAEVALGSLSMFGFEVPEELAAAIKAMYAQKEARASVMLTNLAKTPPQNQDADGANPVENKPDEPQNAYDDEQEDLKRWQRKAVKAVKDGKPAAVAFESECIPAGQMAAIRAKLEGCATVEEIRAVFAGAGKAEAPDLAAELKRANDLLAEVWGD